MHIIFMFQIVMWITILSLYHYAPLIENNYDLYWFILGLGKHAVKANLNSYQLFKSAKH